MATTIKVIDKLQDAIPYSDMGLLWIKYSTGDWMADDEPGYWLKWKDAPRRWHAEHDRGITYGIKLEA